jgi:ankyrin repeat protein
MSILSTFELKKSFEQATNNLRTLINQSLQQTTPLSVEEEKEVCDALARWYSKPLQNALKLSKTTPGLVHPTSPSPLLLAAENGHAKIIAALHQSGVNLGEQHRKGSAATMAAEKGHANIIIVLHQYGVDLGASGPYGFTPATMAAKHNQAEVINVLYDCGVDLGANDSNGRTPAEVARESDNMYVMLLIDKLLYTDLYSTALEALNPAHES